MNVGATEVAGTKINSHTGELDCYGEYYAWGETAPKDTYSSSSFFDSKYSKYNINGKTTLDLDDDAARANWGGSWRMPTEAEQTALRDSCYWEWTESYNNVNVNGYIVYKVKSDSDKGITKCSGKSTTTTASYSLSDKHIFLPAAGFRGGADVSDVNTYGYYWSSLITLNAYVAYVAYVLDFGSNYVYWGKNSPYYGLSVRAVCP